MFLNTVLEFNIILAVLYIIIYNLTILSLLSVILVSFNDSFKNNFQLNQFESNIFSKIWLIIIFLSLAGLPPFVGFSVKIMILNLLIPCYSFTLFFFVFFLIILFLFFYIQNLKIIFTKNSKISFPSSWSFLNVNLPFMYFINLSSFVLLFNLFFLDDIISFLIFLI